MPFVRYALISCALLTTSTAFAGPVARSADQVKSRIHSVVASCRSYLSVHVFDRPAAVFKREPVLRKYDLFLATFAPWTTDGSVLTGRRAGVEWRIETSSRRMTYEIELAPHAPIVPHLRRLADALIGPTRDGLDDDHIHAFRAPRTNTLVVDVPLDTLGLDIVRAMENRRNDPYFDLQPGPRSHTSNSVEVDDDERDFILNWMSKQPIGVDHLLDHGGRILREPPRMMDELPDGLISRDAAE